MRELPILVSQKRALVALGDREFANADYCELNRVDRDTAYRELQDLLDRGLVHSSGVGAGTRYRVIREAGPVVASSTLSPVDKLVHRMREVGFITNADYRDAFGVTRQVALEHLASWVEQEVLVREGLCRGARIALGVDGHRYEHRYDGYAGRPAKLLKQRLKQLPLRAQACSTYAARRDFAAPTLLCSRTRTASQRGVASTR